VALLADDPVGAQRETDDLAVYHRAFELIDREPSQLLAAVRSPEGDLVGTMQLTIIPGLARGAALRLQIEAVRVAATARGGGLGAVMFRWAHDYGRRHGARLAQLTSDKTRVDAHRFYAGLGYEATHEGLKLAL
jgi:GNAT superfamily N-acetyltransferase